MTPEFESLLNTAAARLCGWRESGRKDFKWLNPAKQTLHGCVRKYCTDRNALPELWSHIDKIGFKLYFECELHEFYEDDQCSEVWQMITAPPHKHVIAALKACGEWTQEMQQAWEKENQK